VSPPAPLPEGLPVPVDDGAAAHLPVFEAAGRWWYRRLTLVARAGRAVHVRDPVFPPDRDAEEVLTWLR
jgi:hypothetical protein